MRKKNEDGLTKAIQVLLLLSQTHVHTLWRSSHICRHAALVGTHYHHHGDEGRHSGKALIKKQLTVRMPVMPVGPGRVLGAVGQQGRVGRRGRGGRGGGGRGGRGHCGGRCGGLLGRAPPVETGGVDVPPGHLLPVFVPDGGVAVGKIYCKKRREERGSLIICRGRKCCCCRRKIVSYPHQRQRIVTPPKLL